MSLDRGIEILEVPRDWTASRSSRSRPRWKKGCQRQRLRESAAASKTREAALREHENPAGCHGLLKINQVL